MNGTMMLAHRYSWTIHNGPIPPDPSQHHGRVVMHTCDNRLCVNPAHLRLATQMANVADMDAKGRRRSGSMPGSTHHQSKLTEAQVVEIRLSGEAAPVLATRYGVTPEAIEYARTKGWTHVKVKAKPWVSGKSLATRGASNAHAKLTDEDIRAIRASSERPGVLAKQFGVIPDYITAIRKRRVWKHVT